MLELSFNALEDLALFQTNSIGIIDEWSRNAENIFGYSTKDALGLDFIHLVESQRATGIDFLNHHAEGHFSKSEHLFKKRSGEFFHGEVMIARRPDISGLNLGYIISVVDISERKNKDIQLVKQVEEKKLLLEEIHHRVKNNLQIMSSLVQLQIHTLTSSDESTDKSVVEPLAVVRNQLRAMSSLHQQLYEDTSLGAVNLQHYVTSLFNNMLALDSNHQAELSNKVNKIDVTIDQATTLGLLLNELLTNSFKHAVQDDKELVITVSAQSTDTHIKLCYQDNGPGVAEESNKSLGSKIIGMLVRQLAADTTEKPSDIEGFYLHLTFKIRDH